MGSILWHEVRVQSLAKDSTPMLSHLIERFFLNWAANYNSFKLESSCTGIWGKTHGEELIVSVKFSSYSDGEIVPDRSQLQEPPDPSFVPQIVFSS